MEEMQMTEVARLIEGLRAAGWSEKKINDFLLFIETGKEEYPEIRQKLWKEMFWSQSFCLLSAGGAPIEVIRQYIETQGENKSEHRVPFSDLPE